MKKIIFLILITVYFLISCEIEEQINKKQTSSTNSSTNSIRPNCYASMSENVYAYLSITNKTTNNYLINNHVLKTNSAIGDDPIHNYNRFFVYSYIQNPCLYDWAAAIERSNRFANLTNFFYNNFRTYSIYDTQTNFLFRITNKLIIGEVIVTTNYPPPPYKFEISITESLFTNTYYGTTNE